MIVSTVNTADFQGGAGKAAFRISDAIRQCGVHTFFLAMHKQSNSPYTIRVSERRSESSKSIENLRAFWQNTAEHFFVKANRTALSSTLFSVDPFGLDITEIPALSASRAIHLHWTNGFLSPRSLAALGSVPAPIIWTLHDQWPMTAGCHYSSGCEQYVEGCRICPQLDGDTEPFVDAVFREKFRALRDLNVTLTAPSAWMADCARRSAIFSGADIRVVRNPFDFDVFRPSSDEARIADRKSFGLEGDDVALLFGAQQVSDRRKGFNILAQALFELGQERTSKFKLFAFGKVNQQLRQTGIPVYELGEIHDEQRLAQIYSMADFLILPSIEDNYPNTMVESLGCGTPVVAFNIGGIPDIIRPGYNGEIADGDISAAGLKAAIERAAHSLRHPQVASNCRSSVVESHAPSAIARQFLDLYREKNPRFDEPLDEAELALVRQAEERVRQNNLSLAKLDWASDLFSDERLAPTLTSLFRVYDLERGRIASVENKHDLRLKPDIVVVPGRESGGAKYLGSGWASPELHGCWASARNAFIHLRVPSGAKFVQAKLIVHSEQNSEQSVVVSVNEKTMGAGHVGSALTTLTWAFAAPANDDYIHIKLAFPKSRTVKRNGGITWRSIRLTGISLRPLNDEPSVSSVSTELR